jgi:hypothetical protein
MFNVVRQIGSAIGVAAFTTVIVAVGVTRTVGGHLAPDLTSYHVAFLVAAGLAVMGAAVALTIHDADAAATMVRRGGRASESGSQEATTTR